VPSGSACAAKTRQRKPPVSGAPPPFRTAERLSVAWAESLAGVWAGPLAGAWGESLAGVWAPAGAISATSATKAARIRHVGLNPPRIAENGRRSPMALEGPGRLVTPH